MASASTAASIGRPDNLRLADRSVQSTCHGRPPSYAIWVRSNVVPTPVPLADKDIALTLYAELIGQGADAVRRQHYLNPPIYTKMRQASGFEHGTYTRRCICTPPPSAHPHPFPTQPLHHLPIPTPHPYPSPTPPPPPPPTHSPTHPLTHHPAKVKAHPSTHPPTHPPTQKSDVCMECEGGVGWGGMGWGGVGWGGWGGVALF
jgi:hypothetical protein